MERKAGAGQTFSRPTRSPGLVDQDEEEMDMIRYDLHRNVLGSGGRIEG
jgi:hypothetical protein